LGDTVIGSPQVVFKTICPSSSVFDGHIGGAIWNSIVMSGSPLSRRRLKAHILVLSDMAEG
jgi:hypothetical protein